jgi:hypothetical protein
LVGNPDASKWVIKSMPLRPSIRACHIELTVFPTGVMHPMPVTTTRRLIEFCLVSLEGGGGRVSGTDAVAGVSDPGVLPGEDDA